MAPLVDLVERSIDEFDDMLERALFGTGSPAEVAAAIERCCADHLGGVRDGLFYRAGVGAVAGLLLADGRQVVVKVHRWNASVERLQAVHVVQRHLHRRSFPAPRPLVEPHPMGAGVATVEDLVAGEWADGRIPRVRRSLAIGLHELIQSARALVGPVDVGPPLLLRPPGAPLWPEPHSVRFDFAATAAGAGWIDELATLARQRLADLDGPVVIGHFDWRTENLAFVGDHIAAVYDWDSLAAAPEAVIVGATAGQFCIDLRSAEPDPMPTVDDMVAFVADYEAARSRPFDGRQREVLDAANLALVAYGARCQHSDLGRRSAIAGTGDDRWLRLLRQRGDRALVGAT